MKKNNFRDAEQLSAHLDGELSQADSARLEARLHTDPELRAVMDELSQSRGLLRKLPGRRAPRNFTLTPAMAGVKPPLPRAYPILRFATGLATMLLFVSMAANAILPAVNASQSAPMAAYGIGGGADTCESCAEIMEAPAATEAPAFAVPAVSPTQEAAPNLESNDEPAATEASSQKDALPEQQSIPADAASLPALPIPLAWQIGLLVVALTCGGMAWLLRQASDTSWRGKKK